MKKLAAIVMLGATLIGASPLPAHANAAVDAALALGAFAVFNQLFLAPLWWGRAWAEPVYATAPPVVYSTPAPVYGAAPVYSTAPATAYAPRPPAIQREVLYPHGRYLLYGDGVTSAYQWVWLPNPPSPPPPGAVPPPGSAPPPTR